MCLLCLEPGTFSAQSGDGEVSGKCQSPSIPPAPIAQEYIHAPFCMWHLWNGPGLLEKLGKEQSPAGTAGRGRTAWHVLVFPRYHSRHWSLKQTFSARSRSGEAGKAWHHWHAAVILGACRMPGIAGRGWRRLRMDSCRRGPRQDLAAHSHA